MSVSPQFLALMQSGWKFRLFAMHNVPMAAYARIRVESLSDRQCAVSVPYSRRTTNPFKSTYFAALSAAAELSTGILAMGHLWDHRRSVAMLMVDCKAEFVKKATDLTVFECTQGEDIAAVIETARLSAEPQTLTMETVGRNSSGDIVARMAFTWSFKARGNAGA